MKSVFLAISTRDKRGNALVIMLVFMTTLFAFAALSVDMGVVYVNDRTIQEASDATALAAVREWSKGNTFADAAVNIGKAFAGVNGLKSAELLSIETGIWVNSTKTFTAGTVAPGQVPAVRVVAQRTVAMPFGRVIGFPQMKPRVQAVAIGALASAGTQVLPWAVCDFIVPVEGMTITIQFKSGGEVNACGSGGSGVFGQLSFGGSTGASAYKDTIVNGYQDVLRVGDIAYTDPGGSWGPTVQGINDRIGGLPPFVWSPGAVPNNKRLAILPKVSNLNLSGRKPVAITGFYTVALQGYDTGSKTVIVTFLNSYPGLEVNPDEAPRQGESNTLSLVR